MKVLVPARRLNRDTTSAGICTSKWLVALANAGCDVCCLTHAELTEGERRALGSVGPGRVDIHTIDGRLKPGFWGRVSGIRQRMASGGRIPALAAQKGNALVAYCTGWQAEFWEAVQTWRSALRLHCKEAKPDVVFTHAAGSSFQPHIAMLDLKLDAPWIANYHDPFPVSLYPEPYRHKTPLLSYWQERIHRQILEQADALTFPSQRLLDWVLQGELERHKSKAFVVPHIACALPPAGDAGEIPPVDPNNFNIVHTGTLLGARKPDALIEGFLRFLAAESERTERARLVFVGGVKRDVVRSAIWQKAVTEPCIVAIDQRVPYATAMRLMGLSVAGVVLEADAPESPFFPAKLADICFLNNPVLALTPQRSAVRDMLGSDYPLLASPGSAEEVHQALELLWRCWKEERLSELEPPQALRQSLTASAVASRFREATEWTFSRARKEAG